MIPAAFQTRGVRHLQEEKCSGAALVGMGAGLLAGSWLALKHPALQRADVRVGDAVRHAGSPVVDRAVAGTTDLGSFYAVLGMAATLAATGRRRIAADVAAVGLAAWYLAQHSKTRVRRQRPYDAEGVRRLVRPPTGSSYPSGHAAVGAAVMAVLAEAARSSKGRRILHTIGAYVALSRVYVGVHYPTDVIGGAGLGLMLAGLWRGPVAVAGRLAIRPATLLLQYGARPVMRALRVLVVTAGPAEPSRWNRVRFPRWDEAA